MTRALKTRKREIKKKRHFQGGNSMYEGQGNKQQAANNEGSSLKHRGKDEAGEGGRSHRARVRH